MENIMQSSQCDKIMTVIVVSIIIGQKSTNQIAQ